MLGGYGNVNHYKKLIYKMKMIGVNVIVFIQTNNYSIKYKLFI